MKVGWKRESDRNDRRRRAGKSARKVSQGECRGSPGVVKQRSRSAGGGRGDAEDDCCSIFPAPPVAYPVPVSSPSGFPFSSFLLFTPGHGDIEAAKIPSRENPTTPTAEGRLPRDGSLKNSTGHRELLSRLVTLFAFLKCFCALRRSRRVLSLNMFSTLLGAREIHLGPLPGAT